DIYSLGVLLYELLAGSPPFSRKELEKAGLLEMFRVIREQEPSKPSTKLSTADGLPTLAANRGTEPRRLTALVRGELDWIVMKALEATRAALAIRERLVAEFPAASAYRQELARSYTNLVFCSGGSTGRKSRWRLIGRRWLIGRSSWPSSRPWWNTGWSWGEGLAVQAIGSAAA